MTRILDSSFKEKVNEWERQRNVY